MEDIIKYDEYSGMISNGEILSQDPIFMNDTEDDESEVDDIIILHMDIRQPLKTLRSILEQRVGVPLNNYQFWLQDAQMLESHKNLVDQCVQGEGVVQINVQVLTMTARINIVDVLKPNEDVLDTLNNDDVGKNIKDNEQEVETSTEDQNIVADDDDKDNAQVIKWVVDKQFKKDQLRLQIPDNPLEWTSAMVRHWLQWAVRQFNLTQIKINEWMITGVELCNMSLQEFQNKVRDDPGEIFWTHLELLRKCKFVAIVQKNIIEDAPTVFRKTTKGIKPQTRIIKNGQLNTISGYEYPMSGNRSGNNGQIQLWQFLLEILTDRECKTIIHWLADGNGEFKLSDPEKVAQLWGERKNKPTMNYEKLSRALRYYYDGDMISKVYGKRFVYQFVCDLKQLIGYSAEELANLVNEEIK